MAFTKDICDLTFSDIESLKADKIPEGHMLDYKREFIDDEKLIKHVIAFANMGGGYIVFGVEESDVEAWRKFNARTKHVDRNQKDEQTYKDGMGDLPSWIAPLRLSTQKIIISRLNSLSIK